MTMDKSLRVRRGMVRARSVLTRAERISKLQETDRWEEGAAPWACRRCACISFR